MKSKKRLKGMTLVEIIIAMAVLAIAGSVMCVACGFVSKMKITTNALNKRVSYEAPIADCKIVTYDADGNAYAQPAVEGSTLIDAKDDDGNVILNDDGTTKQKKINSSLSVVDDAGNSYSVDGYLYKATYNGADYGNDDGIVDTTEHNFEFFVIGGIDNE